MRQLLWQYNNRLQIQRLRREFRPKVTFCIEKGGYRVKTIECVRELDQVMRLRYEVFHREYMNRKFPYGLDSDSFDMVADHLVIIDSANDRIVGTYRLIGSNYSNDFYSATEFNIDSFLRLPGNKLELSRACIHRDFRKGVVMNLLWRGLVEYIQKIDAHFLFGCSSIKTMDPYDARLVGDYLSEKNQVAQEFSAHPLPSYRMDIEAGTPGYSYNREAAKALIPPLLNSYLRAGAKVITAPALDRDFRCIDFFTVLNLKDLTQIFERKYTV